MTIPYSHASIATWAIVALATLAVLLRPARTPQWLLAGAGAALLVVLGLLPVKSALAGVARGTDVYLFLLGMMLLAEVARQEGLFDWLAAHAARAAKGSASRLFLFVYGVGILVTTFLSNDATAVVLTPAVAASARAAKIDAPLPYLLICAFIANAASFVLPISNPANLVIYGSHMPALLQWLPRYGLASVLSIAVTFIVLRWTQRGALSQKMAVDVDVPSLSASGKTAAWGIAATSLLLLLASAFDLQLGLPTAIAGSVTAVIVLIREGKTPANMLRHISWGVLALVAGLFVLVEALDHTGVITALSAWLRQQSAAPATAWGAGISVAIVSNLVNNLPAGLIAGSAVQAAHAPDQLTRAILIGIDLGPNLSVNGSLATILWLDALRRDGQHVSGATFLKYGLIVMPPALIAALAGAILLP